MQLVMHLHFAFAVYHALWHAAHHAFAFCILVYPALRHAARHAFAFCICSVPCIMTCSCHAFAFCILVYPALRHAARHAFAFCNYSVQCITTCSLSCPFGPSHLWQNASSLRPWMYSGTSPSARVGCSAQQCPKSQTQNEQFLLLRW